jgi:membrane-bound lytic murein transglycosylase B
MQFIPSTWARWATDGDGDGQGDPQDIDDAAAAAGRYLCANNRDLATGPGWSRAILSYNNSNAYLLSVYHNAERYAQQSVS